MNRFMTDREADKFLWYAFFSWLLSCVHPLIGLLFQFPAIIYLARKCDVKALPALMILMLGKQNLSVLGLSGTMAIRAGITWTSASCFLMSAFFIAVINLFRNKYDQGSMMIGFLWLLSFIPAVVISFQAKVYALAGFWSGPLMDWFIPSLYFWGLLVGKSYGVGRDYLVRRLLLVFLVMIFLYALRLGYVFSFTINAIMIVYAYFAHSQNVCRVKNMKSLVFLGVIFAIFQLAFGRRLALESVAEAGGRELAESDKVGSTFSSMGVVLVAFCLSFAFRKGIGRSIYRLLPILMLVINVGLVSYVITTQAGNNAEEVTYQYQTWEERFKWKLFGDRGTVWAMGWEDVKKSPMVFRDLRQFWVFDPSTGKMKMKLLPHHQFLKILGYDGLWLGGFISLFFIWIWVRAMGAMSRIRDDLFLSVVLLPVGLSVYFIIGMTGQSACTADLWGNALVCIVAPAIAYGHWREQTRLRRMGYWV